MYHQDELCALLPGVLSGENVWAQAKLCAKADNKKETEKESELKGEIGEIDKQIEQRRSEYNAASGEAKNWIQKRDADAEAADSRVEAKRVELEKAEAALVRLRSSQLEEESGGGEGQLTATRDAKDAKDVAMANHEECEKTAIVLREKCAQARKDKVKEDTDLARATTGLAQIESQETRLRLGSHDGCPPDRWTNDRKALAQQKLEAGEVLVASLAVPPLAAPLVASAAPTEPKELELTHKPAPVKFAELDALDSQVRDAEDGENGVKAARLLLKQTSEKHGDCERCGTPVSQEHLCNLRAQREAAVTAAEELLRKQEALQQDARCRADAWCLQEVNAGLDTLKPLQGALDAATQRVREAAAAEQRLIAGWEEKAKELREKETELKACTAAEAAEEKANSHHAERAKQLARKMREMELQQADQAVTSAKEKLADAEKARAVCKNQINPHDIVRQKAEKCLLDIESQRKQHVTEQEKAKFRVGCFEQLIKHFDKQTGVPVMLYKLMLEELEAKAQGYVRSLSDRELELHLRFSDDLKSVNASVFVSGKERAVRLLSGGEWRRVGLGLSLAYADFAKESLSLSCNLMVLDEVRNSPCNSHARCPPLLPANAATCQRVRHSYHCMHKCHRPCSTWILKVKPPQFAPSRACRRRR